MTFRALCEQVLPPDTRFLVLDMDRTVHFARNIGELLGWELTAFQCYGEDALERLEQTRGPGRFVWVKDQPGAVVQYVAAGARRWAYPGLFYLLWGKLPSRMPWMRRHVFDRFGPDPIRRIQRVPQMALMAHLEEASLPVLRSLTGRVLKRHEPDQVIDREDLAWVRERWPGITIVLASASPRPAVEEAAAFLGIDTFTFSTPKRINSGEAKVTELEGVCSGIFEPGVVSVGITDTGYGEDHCWAEHFTVVADINSDTPFPPVVSTTSPCRAIHSAQVLTAAELAKRAAGDSGYLDPRRRQAPPDAGLLVLEADQLRARVAHILDEIEALPRLEPKAAAFALSKLRETARALVRSAS